MTSGPNLSLDERQAAESAVLIADDHPLDRDHDKATNEERKMFDNLKIRWKILGLVGVLSALTAFVAGMGINSMQTYEMRVESKQEAFNRALHAERANGLIYAVVMDSRGVYMSEASEVDKRFGKGVIASLQQMRATMDAWGKILPAAAAARDVQNATDEVAHQADLLSRQVEGFFNRIRAI